MIRNVIWDVDGTLFDTYPAFVAAFSDALSEYGIQAEPEQLLPFVKISIAHAVEVFSAKQNLDAKELLDRFWKWYAEQPKSLQKPFPELGAVLGLIQDRGGKNVIVTHRALESTDQLLNVHGLEAYFDDIVTLEAGYARKPDPEMYHVAINRNRLSHAETLAVGDREIDILAGAAAGVRTCVFQPVELPTTADWVVESYAELLDLLESH